MKEDPSWRVCLAAGFSLGLALFTKSTALIYAFPFLIYYLYTLIKAPGRKAWAGAAVIAFCVVLLNFGHSLRNYDLYGSPLGPNRDLGNTYINEVMSFPVFISNAVRNLALQITTPFDRINDGLEQSIREFHRRLGLSTDDPRTTWVVPWSDQHFHVSRLVISEDRSPNPLHVLLIIAALLILSAKRNRPLAGTLFPYIMQLFIILILFCLLLKWQPWHTRLHLPVFILFAPVIALSLSALNKKYVVYTAVSALFLCSLPFVLFFPYKPLVFDRYKVNIFTMSRSDFFFYYRRVPPYNDYLEAAQFLSLQKYRNIGLSTGESGCEYPLWVFLHDCGSPFKRIEHVFVDNISQIKAGQFPAFDPDVIVSLPHLHFEPDPHLLSLLINNNYKLTHNFGNIYIFVKK